MNRKAKSSDSMGRFMQLGSLVAIGVGVFAVGLGAVLLYGSMQAQLATEQAGRSAEDRARAIATAIESIQSTLGDPQVLQFARGVVLTDATEDDALSQAIRSRGVTNILDLRAFPATIEEIELGDYPEPDFAVIEMLLEARRDRRATAQVHYPGTANENLAFAQAIRHDGDFVGALFLRTPISTVTSLLRDAGSMDYAALVQVNGDDPTVLKSLGVAPSSELRSIPIAGSQLALLWYRSSLVGPVSGPSAIIVGVIGLVLLIAGLLIRRQSEVARVISGELERKVSTPEQSPQGKRDKAAPDRQKPEPVKQRAAERAPRDPEDLPDWLLDGEADDQEQADPAPAPPRGKMPDLPDPLAESDSSDRPQSRPSSSEPSATAEETLFLDDEADYFFEPQSDGDEVSSPSAGRPAAVPRSGDDSGERDYRFEPSSAATEPSDSLEADEPDSLDDKLDDRLDDQLSDEDIEFDDFGDSQIDQDDRLGSGPEADPADETELDFNPEPETEPDTKPPAKSESKSELRLESEPEAPAASKPKKPSQSSGARPEPTTVDEEADEESTKPPILDPALFSSGQISGIVEDTLDARSATMLGQAIGSEARSAEIERVVVARDGRLFGAVLLSALSQGLRAAGVEVVDVGAVPTPILHFAADELTQGSGVMVTGSHLPPEWNGFRIRLAGHPFLEADVEDLFRRIEDDDLASGRGGIEEHNITDRYIERIAIDIQLERSLKVVVDCANGITGTVAPKVLEAIGADVIPLYADVDGNFPNHHPDPSDPDNLEDLKLCVRNFQADLGIAFDGDGDRMALVSNTGDVIWPDRLLMLLASDILERSPDATVVVDSECSIHLKAAIEKAGGRCRTAVCSEAVVAVAMIEDDALLGGTFSGNLFVAERWFAFDDAIYGAARLIELLAADARSVSDRLAELPEVEATPQIRIPVESGQAGEIVDALAEKGDFDDAELSRVDGLRVDYPNAWGTVRAARSARELVLRFEGDDSKAMNQVKTLFKKQLRRVAPDLKLLF